MHYIREVSVRYGKAKRSRESIRTPEAIAKLTRKIIKENGKEHVILFCLDGNHAVAAYNVISIGNQTSAPIHPREIFQTAILAGSVSFVLTHNHPSGNVEPSREDINMTKLLLEGSKLLGIKFLDHIIVGDFSHYSMHEYGYMDKGSRNSLIG
jgi:DNA repair protein RadC